MKPASRINWFVLVLAVMAGYFAYLMWRQQGVLGELARNQVVARERLAAARERNAQLRVERARMDDPVYLEKVAREDLGLIRQGETPYVVSPK